MHHAEWLKLAAARCLCLPGSAVYLVLHGLQYLSLPDLSSYHSLGYGRNGLVWALAGCWDMKLGLGRPVDPPPPAQWNRQNDSKESDKSHKTSCSDANHTNALFFFSFPCRPCRNCRYLRWAGEAVVFLLFSLSLVLSVSQPLPG